MAVQFNADFNRFVNFATEQNASGKAIDDAANGKFDVGGLAREVVVASGDKVGAWFRSQTFSPDKIRHNPKIESLNI